MMLGFVPQPNLQNPPSVSSVPLREIQYNIMGESKPYTNSYKQ
ncbi:hypothetical protein PCC7424_5053 [Gloeothece citriformis PCC 7424]|uniref:Uncharacterized protein n=1 Tax=Gloeothece citriformis (strain PCC 7424) TaxID=65393 RepID=B7KFT0_GLOC7|nr:hypothetical protein PCC7424_5053 [Gloeothece citriformis PCC 7424]